MKTDVLTRFILEDLSIRGEFVILHKTTGDLLSKHNYPTAIRSLLGQMTCASLLLSGTLKIDGSTSIQAKGNGPITSIMAESTHQSTCRGIALWQNDMSSDQLHDSLTMQQEATQGKSNDLLSLLGKEPILVITLTPNQGQRYQGIVSLEDNDLASCLENYFIRSEQLNTMIRLFQTEEYWGGLLLQQLPVKEKTDNDRAHWQEATALTDTLSFSEMLGTETELILHRLFHQHDIRILQDRPTRFQCTCSEERTLAAIRSIGQEEAYAIIAEQGAIDMDCQFCKQHYRFGKTKIDRLFDDPTVH